MKVVLIAALVALGVMSAGVAQASAELAEKQCGKCHEMEKKKKGPSYKTIAAKYKGKPDAEAAAFKATTDPKGAHPENKATPEDIKTVIKWILQQ